MRCLYGDGATFDGSYSCCPVIVRNRVEVTAEALAVLLFLLPGFLASRIVGTIVVRRSTDHVREAIEALIYSFLIYAALDLVGWGVVVYEPAGGSAPQVDLGRAWHALVAAVLFAIVCGAFINHDLHMRFLRWAGLTNKTARANTWLDVFAERHDGVMVNYADGRRGGPLLSRTIARRAWCTCAPRLGSIATATRTASRVTVS